MAKGKRKLVPAIIKYDAHPYGNEIYMFRYQEDFVRKYRELTKQPGFNLPAKYDGICSQLECEGESDVFLIGWFKPWKISTLAHECDHCAFQLCHEVGIRLKWDNNEAHAYMLGDMIDVFLGVRK